MRLGVFEVVVVVVERFEEQFYDTKERVRSLLDDDADTEDIQMQKEKIFSMERTEVGFAKQSLQRFHFWIPIHTGYIMYYRNLDKKD